MHAGGQEFESLILHLIEINLLQEDFDKEFIDKFGEEREEYN